MRVAALLAALVLSAAPLPAAGETLFIEAGLVLPVDGEPVPDGRIIVRDGRVTEVGAGLERPPFSRLVEAHGLTVTPGFVVSESSIGLPAPNDRASRPDQPVRVSTSPRAKGVDELYPLHRDYARLLQQGVTTLALAPVSGRSGVRGQVSAISTKSGEAKAMTLEAEAAVLIDCDAHGPWRDALSGAFEKAREAAEKEQVQADEKKKRGAPGRGGRRGGGGDESKNPMVRVLQGKTPLHVAIDGGATWIAAVDALPLEDAELVVLEYGRAWELTDELARTGARVVTSPVLVNRPRSRMPVNRAAEYERAGIPYAFRLPSDDPEGAAVLRDQAIEMVRTGASRDSVLAALTLEGAKALGLAESVGSVQAGRRADLLFWSAHPLDPLATLERILVGGEEVERTPRATLGRDAGEQGDGA